MYRLVYKITNDTNLIHLVDLLVQGCLVLQVPLVISIYFIFCFVDKKTLIPLHLENINYLNIVHCMNYTF